MNRLGCRDVPAVLTMIALMSMLVGCASVDSAPPRRPPSQAAMRRIRAAPGVSLACLDFGGAGEPLVLLAGAGNSAHVFEFFAPLFTDRFRVVAVTRRGYGESSKPASGYDTATLAADILAVLDAYSFGKAHLLGHSMAGAEMTRLACMHPERVLSLVYVDAAYDWAAQAALASALPPPPAQPEPDRADLRSPAAYAAYWARMVGVPAYPVSDILATTRFSKRGRYRGSITPQKVALAVGAGLAAEHPDYASVRAPILSVYAAGDAAEILFPWLAENSARRDEAIAFQVAAAGLLAGIRADFRRKAPNAEVAEIEGPHFIFLKDPRLVAELVRAFLLESRP